MAIQKKDKKFIQKAIKRKGLLTKEIGGKPSQNLGKVRKQAKEAGKPGMRARFFLNVLRKIAQRKKMMK